MAMKSSPKPKKKKILLALMAGLVSLCLCVIVAALIAPDRETAQIAAVQQSTSTSAPVPPAMKPADTYMKFASVEMDLVIENYSQGIDTLEMEYITAATQHMEKVSEYVGKATEEMGK